MEPKYLVAAVALPVGVFALCWQSCMVLTALCGLVAVVAGGLGGFYFYTKDPAFTHKFALKKFSIHVTSYVLGFFDTRRLNRDSKNIRAVQEKVLLDILQLNATSEYSRLWKLDQVRSREEFRKAHPLSKYAQFESYFNRQAEGEKNVITTEDPVYYGTTSGTTGKASLIPFVPTQLATFREYFCVTTFNLVRRIPSIRRLDCAMRIYYNPERCLVRTPSGVLSGPASAYKGSGLDPGAAFTSPPAGFDIDDEHVCRYVHVLFGLRNRDLQRISTVFVPLAFYAMEEIEREAEHLVSDIRNGTLKADLKLPDHIRKELEAELTPDPARADELEREFKKGFHQIAKRIWPKLEWISCISGGPFAHYKGMLATQYTGDVLIFDPLYGATEGVIGMDLWPNSGSSAYMLFPRVFFEFIKVEHASEDQPETLFIDQVEIGEQYELVLTTHAGLTRYRFGDVVKVVRKHNQLPVIEFQYRSGHLLNIRGEKMSDITFVNALNTAVNNMPNIQRVVDYSICTNLALPQEGQVAGELPYYVFFVELSTTGKIDHVALEKELSQKVDDEAQRSHLYYRFYRGKNALDPMKVVLIKTAGFVRLRSYMLDNSKTSPSQLKIPRVLIKPPLVNFVYGERIVSSSPASPKEPRIG